MKKFNIVCRYNIEYITEVEAKTQEEAENKFYDDENFEDKLNNRFCAETDTYQPDYWNMVYCGEAK